MNSTGDIAPIFVVGNPKSGTSLVQALLDAHPQLYVIPVELQFFKFPALPSLPPGNMPPSPLPTWKVPIPRPAVSIQQLMAEILGHAELGNLLGGDRVQRRIQIAEAQFDRQRFETVVRAAKPQSLRDLYLAFLRAFPEASGDERRAGEYRFVEKCPHMEEYAAELKTWFPDARFIHVLRNPYANLYSLLQGSRLKRDLRDQALRHMAKSYYFMERNHRYLQNYHIVRYEDVVESPEKTMRSVAAFLGISFNTSLLEPTIMGRPWEGNARTVAQGFAGIDKRPVRAFEGSISPLLVALVNRFFSTLLAKYHYDPLEIGKWQPWLPLRWEHPAHYWANRKLLWGKGL